MFENTSKLAERVASNLSRRHFLGSVGRWAGATALTVAGVLTTAGTARAASKTCCQYGTYTLPGSPPFVCGVICVASGSSCPTIARPKGCSSNTYRVGSYSVQRCADCKV
jgi:hypothetical protein